MSSTESESNPDRIGPYRLEGELGVGGMGEVYRAMDERLERPVAVKHIQMPPTMKDAECDRFWHEARATARLSHPAIVQVFDVLEDHRGGWIVMELVEGETLAQRLDRGSVGVDDALRLVTDVTEALVEAHGKGILHRDLKTENVMVTPSGRAKLLDFGLARRIGAAGKVGVTVEAKIGGTPHAMSPEQAMSLEVDHRSDLFSLGSLLYEALTGVRAFSGDDMVATLHQVCVVGHQPVVELEPRIPEELSRLVDRLLEKDPDDRPESAEEVVRALRAVARTLPEEVPDAGTGTSSPPRETGKTPTPSGERCQITLVHCELTGASGALDPEEIMTVRPELWSLGARMAKRFDGEVGELSDQGLTLLFGYPEPRKDDVERALLAAEGVVAGVAFLADSSNSEGLSVRVGVHTGTAVVAGAGQPALALGETATTAAALQRLARPGAVLLSAATREVVAPFARTEALPKTRFPGLAAPLEAFRWISGREGGVVGEPRPVCRELE